MSKPNVAIIGVSGFAGTHYNDLMRFYEAGKINIVGAAVINQAEEQEKCKKLSSIGCRIFEDYREMLTALVGQAHLCCIPTGIALHAEMSIAALRAGINVFVEKPFTATIEDALAVEAMAAATGCFVAVGYQWCYPPIVKRIKEIILKDGIGKLQSISCLAMWPRGDIYYSRNAWAGKLKSQGAWVLDSPFNNAHAHYLNEMCLLAGTGFKQTARLKTMRAALYRANSKLETPDTACMHIVTKENVKLNFLTTHCSEGFFDPEIIIKGSEGSIWFDVTRMCAKVESSRGMETFADSGHCRDMQLAAVLNRINDSKMFICTTKIAIAQTLCANAAYSSVPIVPVPQEFCRTIKDKTGSRVVVNNLDDTFKNAWREHRVLNSNDYPWWESGAWVDLDNYFTFAPLNQTSAS